MTESGKIRRKRNKFSQVSNHCLQNNSLSLKAKGLYALIQSLIEIPDFTLYKSVLMDKYCVEGKEAFNSTWKELINAGYLKTYKLNSHTGFVYEYELLDEPEAESNNPDQSDESNNLKSASKKTRVKSLSPGTENPDVGPDTDFPGLENPTPNNTNKNNTKNLNIEYSNNTEVSNSNLNGVSDVVNDISNPSKKIVDVYPVYEEVKSLIVKNELSQLYEDLEKGEKLLKYLASVAKDRKLHKVTTLLNDLKTEEFVFNEDSFSYEMTASNELCKYPLTRVILELAESYNRARENVEGYALTVLRSLADRWALDKNFLRKGACLRSKRVEFKQYEPDDYIFKNFDTVAINDELQEILSMRS